MITEPAKIVTAADLLPELDSPRPPSNPPDSSAAVSAPPAALTSPAVDVETDSAGVPFDAARHLSKKHPATGRWMPRGGRKPKSAAPASPASSSASTSSPPPASSGVSPASSTPPADDIPDVAPSDAPADAADNAGPGDAAPDDQPAGPVRDAALSPKRAGELAARALYKVAGDLSGDRKRAVAKGEEHESIKQTFAAYFEFRGLKLVGGLALAATIIAYLLTDDRSDGIGARVRDWLSKRRAGRSSPASSSVIDIDPAAPSAPRPAPETRNPAPSPFAGRGI